MLAFEEREKQEYPEKNLSVQSREPTNSTHVYDAKFGPHWWEASALTTAPSHRPMFFGSSQISRRFKWVYVVVYNAPTNVFKIPPLISCKRRKSFKEINYRFYN